MCKGNFLEKLQNFFERIYNFLVGRNLPKPEKINTYNEPEEVEIPERPPFPLFSSNDGSLLNCYNRNIVKCGIDPILNKYRQNYKKIKYAIPSFFSLKKIFSYFFSK